MAESRIISEEYARLASRLKLYFAILTCLSGLVLSTGSDGDSIRFVAIFFAIFGYLFVDRLELFALPPIAAYAAMAVAAFYCVGNFSDLDSPGNRQMTAVAELLVFVQAILMLQRKSRRIFEQLGVFCLLELVVAAVFNDAINYGLLLVPIAIIGAWAMSLLAAVAALDGVGESQFLRSDETATSSRPRKQAIEVSSESTVSSFVRSSRRLPKIALFTLAPSVVLVGAIFFYALPRTTNAARVSGGGNVMVGFADTLQLGQIGRMLESSESVLRIDMKRQGTGEIYRAKDGIYLRGRALESYQSQQGAGGGTSSWTGMPSVLRTRRNLPPEFVGGSSGGDSYDPINVEVTCETMSTPTLFAISPYYRTTVETAISHQADRWTLERRDKESQSFGRITYRFSTNAFLNGFQTDLLCRTTEDEWNAFQTPRFSTGFRDYEESLLKYDVDSIPHARDIADDVSSRLSEGEYRDYRLAKALERKLALSGEYRYTLDLTFKRLPGVDPIEQFLSVDKAGHCQFFASALAMMLRSQGIPARLVVGYRTEEFNELGNYHIARQSHAHVWVEALFDKDSLPGAKQLDGQFPSKQYWVRLDPTPGGGGVGDRDAGRVEQLIHLTKNMWDDYVVDMDGERQENALLSTPGATPMTESYGRFVEMITDKIRLIRAGELGGGSLASGNVFSWQAAVVFVMFAMVVFALMKMRTPGWIKKRLKAKMSGETERPDVSYYAAALDQLARVGISRRSAQTPAELAVDATEKLSHPMIPSIEMPLDLLTRAFYNERFGSKSATEGLQGPGDIEQALGDLTKSIDLTLAGSEQSSEASNRVGKAEAQRAGESDS